ncbi:hypothetical protein P4637_01875 [Halalkalibacterium halodurans]|uniref:BH1891 protein n=1 Tax=Halalkalibacterium halodurans (strain ATCC BAA-125 / DSM 18197 / FERM 7344 / JCM 9153 / C-125) TaxID=272558 RepID=Q9KBN4_HALH5|nr:hypothetical protein [Halalkalibacterium halodurans]MED4082242.1 hypothetical protein [Halalkalibacterium halodurans]MED4083607.1 hypothetical protein [Halalkalibacterium halodurans]MED4105920.1 hypothetical protein [Halalkalibacterium halodurans]MED4110032.1 hypothetical protein [Halalkalibacterium halodurans]MED4149373.1 hypothetical protein [Halalkalibacterium halodurans]
MQLTREQFDRVKAYVMREARPLDRQLFRYYFEGGDSDKVARELAAFQNEDGGFGHSLEPDFRLIASSSLATTVGMQYARAIGLPSEHPIVKGAIGYFLNKYDEKKKKWQIVPKEVNNVPHAPWWHFDEGNDFPGEHDSWANPGAEIVAYLYEHRSLVPATFLAEVTENAMQAARTAPLEMEIHDFYCFARLLDVIPDPYRTELFDKLSSSVRVITALGPSEWDDYGAKPLQIAPSPHSPFAPLLEKQIAENLDYEIKQLGEEGYWKPNWSWFGHYEDVWKQAEIEWRGYLTVHMLKVLQNYGRLETLQD